MLATGTKHLVRAEHLHSDDRLTAANGVYGDPRRSSVELGQIGVDAIVTETVAVIKRELNRR
jgi:creatinine amidohydrolase/Fe(II)-dependent formamide hydrolase-like protein